jgi:hypothetical protein
MIDDSTPSVPDSIKEQPVVDDAAETAKQQLLLEMSKALLSGALASTRGAMQILQGLTGVLLTSYITLLVGFSKQLSLETLPAIILVLPIFFYMLSLLTGFLQIILFRGARVILGDLRSGFNAYEAIVNAQRKQLIMPLVLTLAGITSVIIIAICLRSSC